MNLVPQAYLFMRMCEETNSLSLREYHGIIKLQLLIKCWVEKDT